MIKTNLQSNYNNLINTREYKLEWCNINLLNPSLIKIIKII
jgi:hypothetical protein